MSIASPGWMESSSLFAGSVVFAEWWEWIELVHLHKSKSWMVGSSLAFLTGLLLPLILHSILGRAVMPKGRFSPRFCRVSLCLLSSSDQLVHDEERRRTFRADPNRTNPLPLPPPSRSIMGPFSDLFIVISLCLGQFRSPAYIQRPPTSTEGGLT